MERKFSFDDMTFVARSEQVGDVLRVGIHDAWDNCRLEADYPAGGKGKAKGRAKSKGVAPAATPTVSSVQEQAIDNLIASFKRKVEAGEIDLA
jgi:hypothetical protein